MLSPRTIAVSILVLIFTVMMVDTAEGRDRIPKHLKKTSKNLEADDQVQAAVFEILRRHDAGFDDIIGPNVTDERRAEIRDAYMKTGGYRELSRMELLREAEAHADSAQEFSVPLMETERYAYQTVTTARQLTTRVQAFRWFVPVTVGDGESVAQDYIERMERLFKGDKNWMQVRIDDDGIAGVRTMDKSNFMSPPNAPKNDLGDVRWMTFSNMVKFNPLSNNMEQAIVQIYFPVNEKGHEQIGGAVVIEVQTAFSGKER